jgi:hypothetical protein
MEMQGTEMQGMSLKRRIGILAAAVVVASTMFAAPAQAANRLGKECERDFKRQSRELQCCENRADNNKQERNCKQYVRNH